MAGRSRFLPRRWAVNRNQDCRRSAVRSCSMRSIRQLLPLIATLLVSILAAGCGRSNSAAVAGQVTLDGLPLTQGTVVFHPVAEGPTATAALDVQGFYELKTGGLTGLPAGDYIVTVASTAGVVEPGKNRPQPLPGRLVTPPQYRSRSKSPLRFSAQPGSNQFDIELSSP